MTPKARTACLLAIWPALAHASACETRASAQPPAIVELYTSEGCSSCPPADRWLSSLKGRDDTIALAFHVDYWDRLGWPDRFATAANTERQQQLSRASGARSTWPRGTGGRCAAILRAPRMSSRWPPRPTAPFTW